MKPIIKLASTRAPDGSVMALFQHDNDFSIKINDLELMHSRQNESERELARLGCAHLAKRRTPRVLIGGLGMGYTLREALDVLGRGAEVTVSELVGDVIKWNRELIGDLTGNPLDDKRVVLRQGDVVSLIQKSKGYFDAILLDVDNGPAAMTDSANSRLYTRDGIRTCELALRDRGCLAIWSAEACKKFEREVLRSGFHIRRYRVPVYKGSKSQAYFIWVAARDRTILPDGGGEPLPPSAARRDKERRVRR